MIDKQGTNLGQITTCEGQKEVCQLYPLSPGLAITRQEGQCKLAQVFSLPVVGIIYSVRHDLCFELTMFFSSRIPDTASLVCGLRSVIDREQKSRNELQLRESDALLHIGVVILFTRAGLHLSGTRALVTLYSEKQCEGATLSKAADVSLSSPFPWLLILGVRTTSKYSLMFTHPTLSVVFD